MRSTRSRTLVENAAVAAAPSKSTDARKNKSVSRGRTLEKETQNEKLAQKPTQSRSQAVKPQNKRGASADKHQKPQNLSAKKSDKATKLDTNEELVYAQGSYVAFIDFLESLKEFKIAHLTQDLKSDEADVIVDIYEETEALKYTRSAVKVPILEYVIICDVNVDLIPQSSAKKGTKPAAQPSIKINRQQYNKVARQMENAIRRIEDEKESEEEDSESDSESEQESDDQEGPVQIIESLKKDSATSIRNRKIVKVTRSNSIQSKPKASEVPGKKTPTRKPSSKKNSEDIEIINKEEELSLELINTSSKKKRAESAKPKVGQKRVRVPSTKKSQEDEAKPVKKKKVVGGKAQNVEKPSIKKKATKKPTEFKKGKWNPQVELVTEDKEKESLGDKLLQQCCPRCNNRNIIRAAITGNQKLMKAAIDAKDSISLLTDYWSPEVFQTSVDYIVQSNNHQLLELLMHPNLDVPVHSSYDVQRDQLYSSRVSNPPYLLNFVDTGKVSDMAYGRRIRKVNMTRGNREGNNAFLQFQTNQIKSPLHYVVQDQVLTRMLYSDSVTYDTIKQIYKLNPNIEQTMQTKVYEAVRAGNRRFAYEAVKKMVPFENFGFNQLHADVLSDNAVLDKVLKQSVTKKSNNNKDLCPLHSACINPNPKYLQALLATGAEIQTPDLDLRRPVHYAAACVGTEPLKVLITAGANLLDQDNQLRNCLHLAAMTGRADNIRVILQAKPDMLKLKDKKSMTALGYACKYGKVEAVKAILEVKAKEFKVKINAGIGSARMSPLVWASAYGHLELVEFLLDQKARVLSKDKFKRTALTMAVRNGHTKIASLLLQRGSEWDHPDSSSNTPLHYAAAYGWLECINLLLKTGAQVNAENSWKMTPINIAMIKNHHGCVKRFLEEPNIDVNGKDDRGRTLLMLSLSQINSETYEFISFLLKKGADPNIADIQSDTPLLFLTKSLYWHNDYRGNPLADIQISLVELLIQNKANQNITTSYGRTCLHLLVAQQAQYEAQVKYQERLILYFLQNNTDPNIKDSTGKTCLHYLASKLNHQEFQIKAQKDLIAIFTQHKADLSLKDNSGLTPFAYCVANDNYPLFQFFIDKVSLNKEPMLFFQFKEKIFNVEYQRFLLQIIKSDPPTQENMNCLNEGGHTPLLAYLESYTSKVGWLKEIIQNRVRKHTNYNYYGGVIQESKIKRCISYKLIYQMAKDEISQGNNNNRYYYYNQLYNLKINFKDNNAIQEMITTFFEKILMKPFIEFLRQLIENGADVNSKVQKLKLFRDAEQEEKQRQQRLREIEEQKQRMEITGEEEEKALIQLTEEEQKLKVPKTYPDQYYDMINGVKILREYGQDGLRTPMHYIVSQPHKELFDLFISYNIQCDVVDYNQNSPFSEFSSIYDNNNPTHKHMIDHFLTLPIRFDVSDNSGCTPFLLFYQRNFLDYAYKFLEKGANINQIDKSGNFALKYAVNRVECTEAQKLIDHGADVNLIDQSGSHSLFYAINSRQISIIDVIIKNGADLSKMNKDGVFPLKCALAINQLPIIQVLIDYGAKINQLDNKGRNLLHHAINMQKNTADATFETEQLLIDNGIDINVRDHRNRTPLHYAFVKIRDWQSCNQIDPIETVSSLCGCKGLEIDVPDKWQKTPLHYASQHGASICALYLVQRGAMLESKDIYGNTPLSLGLTYSHNNYGIFLIQKGALVKPLCLREDPYKIHKMWEEDKKAAAINMGEDVQMKEEGNSQNDYQQEQILRNQLRTKQNTGLISENDMEGVSQFKIAIRGAALGLAYLIIDNGYDLMLAMQDAMDEKKFNLVLTLLQKTSDDLVIQSKNGKNQTLFHIISQNSAGCNLIHLQRIFLTLLNRGVDSKCLDNFGKTALHYATKSNSKELVQLFLTKTDVNCKLQDDTGSTALHYAVINQSLNIVQMLVTQGGADSKAIDNTGGTALHYAAKNSSYQIAEILVLQAGADCNVPDNTGSTALHYAAKYSSEDIFDLLVTKAGANCNSKDDTGSTPLHYAVTRSSGLVITLLTKNTGGCNPNELNNSGDSPMIIFIRKIHMNIYREPYDKSETLILKYLQEAGAEINVLYHETCFDIPKKKAVEITEKEEEKAKYYCTPIIKLARLSKSEKDKVINNFITKMLEYGASLEITDSIGRDAIMYAVIENKKYILNMINSNKNVLKMNLSGRDHSGKSAVHYAVNPILLGSYENVEILELLYKSGIDLNLEDAEGKTPAYYASLQESGVMLKKILLWTGQGEGAFSRERYIWPDCKYDYTADAEAYIEAAIEKEKAKPIQEYQRVPVDPTGNFEVSYSVYYDDAEKPWDIYLNKVNLKNGVHGEYVFYKMQLLHDSNRDLYVIFTRWGRIGEDGMNQRTPFPKLQEAKVEFKKIFKDKTGGNNFEELENFKRDPKKYKVVHVNYNTKKKDDYLVPFDNDKDTPQSCMPEKLRLIFQRITDAAMYRRAISQFGIDTHLLPFSGINANYLVEARKVLDEISECLKEDQQLASQGINADYEKIKAIKEKISDLSSTYYELIPLQEYQNQIAPPLSNQNLVQDQLSILEQLKEIQYASKLLLGALLRQKEINPIDYIYQAMNIKIESLDCKDLEYEALKTYINNTRTFREFEYDYQKRCNVKREQILNIFKLSRKEEEEKIEAFKETPNHFLLFHGSRIFNFLGILSQGLRIAPPEAPSTGYMFGKGVYFADMFEKSANYCGGDDLMLICEVVLGKQKKLIHQQYIQQLEAPYQSVKGCGGRGPDYKKTITLPNGAKIPLGSVINYERKVKKQNVVAGQQAAEPKVQPVRKNSDSDSDSSDDSFSDSDSSVDSNSGNNNNNGLINTGVNNYRKYYYYLHHNEYIVYNTAQIRMRYLVQFNS